MSNASGYAYSDFPNGITSFGIPTFGAGGLLPFTGAYFWVNETIGSDGNPGTANAPFATLGQALLAVSNTPNYTAQTNVIFLTGTVHLTATLNWTLSNTWLVGLNSPSANDRARISQSGTTLFTPLVNVTGSGCGFVNIATFHGFATASAQICWSEGGGRNFYSNVQFLGMGATLAAAQAGSRSLVVTGANGENVFNGCTIGLDTITRATSNASLEFTAGTPRNTFHNCTFQMLTSSASSLHVTVGADGIDRYALFNNCVFINDVDTASTTLNAAIIANASAGGSVILNGGLSLGATAIATTGPVYVNGAVPVATTSSIAIKAT